MKRVLLLTFMFTLVISFHAMAQRTVSGKVVDDTGEAIPGVNVVVKGTTNGTTSDIDGNYRLSVPEEGGILVFSFIGLLTKEVEIGARSIVDVDMDSDTKELSEVVVIGYGISMNENEKTGSWAKIDSKEIEQLPFGSVDQAIQGRVAGLQFSSSGGNPYAAATVVIRGPGTISGSMNPLYVVDGVPIGNGSNLSDVQSSVNPLSYLNPNDIESVVVLKDAASTSIYGSRGANGVIVITTKSGKGTEGTQFSLMGEVNFSNVAYDKREYLNAQEYSDWGDLALGNAGVDVGVPWGEYLGWDGETDTDWLDAVTRNHAVQKTYQFSASGGSDMMNYRASIGYVNSEPLAKYTGYDKYTLSFNSNINASDKIKINFTQNAAYQMIDGNTVSGSFSAPYFSGSLGLPIDPVYNEDGTLNVTDMSGYYGGWGNPLAQLKDNLNATKIFTLNGAIGFNYEPIKGLTYNPNFAYNYQNYNEQVYWNPAYGDGASYDGYGYAAKSSYFQYNFTNFVRYQHTFASVHHISADIGLDYQATYRQRSYFEGQSYSKDNPDLVYASEPIGASENHEYWALWGAIGRISYEYDSKYSVWGSLRRDYATIFAPDFRVGYFWSAGLSWNVHEELFMRGVSPITKAVLRANYGTSGDTPNTGLDDTQNFNPLLSAAVYGSESAFTISSSGNDELTWQTAKTLNMGADLGFLNNRITLSVDRYVKTTSDLILEKPIAYSNGGPNSILSNVGEIQNRGWEFVFSGIPVKTNDFTWEIGFNAAYNKSEVVSLVDTSDISVGGNKRLVVGEEVGTFYTRGYAGVDSETGAPLFYEDESETTTVDNSTDASYYLTGKAFPTWSGGINTRLSYKGFSVNALFTYATNFQVYDVYNFIMASDGEYLYADQYKAALYDSWTPENTNAKYPQQIYGGNNGSNDLSSRYLYDGDYIRLKELKIAYSFSKNLLDKIKLNDLTVYVRGTNLWTKVFDDDLLVDPESNSSDGYTSFEGKSLYNNVSPVMKNLTIGVSVGF